ncbi:MAG: sigma-70 family RNA polymerase sigma factor [Clostridia bacterium]|nr:sigma-70 family RNA polymerase sigma factor [Clostridia bacterium]
MISCERAAEIAELYYEDIYHFCLSRIKDEEYASDTTQEVFLFFQEKSGALEDRYIKTWLFSVADKKIKEKFREIAKREKSLIFNNFGGKSLTEITTEIEYDDLITAQDIEDKKADILASLTDKELELFEMVYTKHKKYSELAKSLNISENAARTRVHRLNLKIKEKIIYAFMVVLLVIMKI